MSEYDNGPQDPESTPGGERGPATGDDRPQAEAEPALPPYVIEGARSSRSRCKTCRRKIDKGALRIGILIEGPYGTGYMWHHINCAARRHLHRVEEAYELEAWKLAKQPPQNVPDIAKLRGLQELAEERKKTRKQIPHTEPAPTGRAKCKHCDQPIEKDSMRVVLGREVEFGNQVRVGPINVHPRCVAAELKADDCGTSSETFAEQLRANSEGVPADRVAATITEIGDL